MDKDRIKGSVKQADGSARMAIGKLSDDPSLVAEGKVRKAEGRIQKAFGKIKDMIRSI